MIAADIVTGLFALAAIAGVYFAPTIIAMSRKVPNTMSIAVVNFFLGWTLIGWVVALAWSVKTLPHRPKAWEQGQPMYPPRPRDWLLPDDKSDQ